jgi:RNA polymerase sigma factor (sigma-70 family)
MLTVLLRAYIEERDPGALDAFFHLLYDEHFRDLEIQVQSFGRASELTVREVINDSMSKLLEDVVQEKYRKTPESAKEHLKYLLRRKFIDRRRWWDEDHKALGKHEEKILDKKAPSPDEEAIRKEEGLLCDERVAEALDSLSTNYQKILRLRLQGADYAAIGKELGLKEDVIWSYAKRAVEALMSRLVESAPTMALRLAEMKERAKRRHASENRWPTMEEIKEALPRITERVRSAITRLHLYGVSREDLGRELGEETLQILLRRGYDLLEARFKVSFPEAFERSAE